MVQGFGSIPEQGPMLQVVAVVNHIQMNINSSRRYQIVEMVYGNEGIQPVISMTLNEILQDDKSELAYALWQMLDEILDLQEYQSMYFQPNRDVGQSKAILLRTH